MLEKGIKDAGKEVRPAVKTLAGFRKAKRAKQALILKEFLRAKDPLLNQNNEKLYLNSSAYQYVMQIQRTYAILNSYFHCSLSRLISKIL